MTSVFDHLYISALSLLLSSSSSVVVVVVMMYTDVAAISVDTAFADIAAFVADVAESLLKFMKT